MSGGRARAAGDLSSSRPRPSAQGSSPSASRRTGLRAEPPAASDPRSSRRRPQPSLRAWPWRPGRIPGLFLRKALATEGPSLPRKKPPETGLCFPFSVCYCPKQGFCHPKQGTGIETPSRAASAASRRGSRPGVPRPVPHGEGLCARTYRCPPGDPARLPGALFAGCAPRCLCPLLKDPHPSCPQDFSISSLISRALVFSVFLP